MHNMYRTNYAALSIVDREDLASRTSTPMREERPSAREAGRLPGNFAKRTCFENISKSFELSLLSQLVPVWFVVLVPRYFGTVRRKQPVEGEGGRRTDRGKRNHEISLSK